MEVRSGLIAVCPRGSHHGGDGGVEYLHKGSEHDGHGDEPGIDARFDFGGLIA